MAKNFVLPPPLTAGAAANSQVGLHGDHSEKTQVSFLDTDLCDDVVWEDGYENLHAKNMSDSDSEEYSNDLQHQHHRRARRGGRNSSSSSSSYRNNQQQDSELQWQLPENSEELSAEVLSSLPAHIRKSLIEEARRRQRTESRANYLPVAGNPALYSQTQLSNFLNSRL